MWFDRERQKSHARFARVIAAAMVLAGVVLAPFGLFALAVGVVMLATDDHPSIGVLTSLFGVAVAGLGVVAFFRARARWLQTKRFDALAAAIARVPTMPPADLEVALGWPRHALCEALLEAASARIVLDLAQPLFAERGTRSGLAPGDVLEGRFRIQAALGEGGMGKVFRAVDVFSGGAVALKIPHAQANQKDRLEREAEALLQIEHPNVQRVRFVGRCADGTPYLVTDLLVGEGLDRRLERFGALPWRDALVIADAVGRALAASHEKGVLHRDIKPANVFLEHRAESGERARGTKNGGIGDVQRVVLIDFGLARVVASAVLTRSGAAVGTPLYMSPEQARGEPLDERSDVYALAQLVFEMITGAPPSFDVTEANIYDRLLHHPAPAMASLAEVPAGLDAVIARGLAKHRDERHASATELADALARFTREEHHVA